MVGQKLRELWPLKVRCHDIYVQNRGCRTFLTFAALDIFLIEIDLLNSYVLESCMSENSKKVCQFLVGQKLRELRPSKVRCHDISVQYRGCRTFLTFAALDIFLIEIDPLNSYVLESCMSENSKNVCQFLVGPKLRELRPSKVRCHDIYVQNRGCRTFLTFQLWRFF